MDLQVIGGSSATIFGSDGRNLSEHSITFREGERIELVCRGNDHANQIKWLTSEGNLKTDDNLQINDGKLIINKANRKNAKLYQCLVEGKTKNDVAITSLNVNIERK